MSKQVIEKRFQLVADHGTSHSAWTKAPADVATIAEGMGFERMAAERFWPEGQAFVRRVFRKLRLEQVLNRLCWKLQLASLRRKFGRDGGELLLQHPLPGSWSFSLKNVDEIKQLKDHGIKIVILVHDIGQLRGNAKEVGGGGDHSFERKLFTVADKLIVHNRRMREWLKNQVGLDCKVESLEIFDYLVEADVPVWQGTLSSRVLVAGGFGPGKARYIQGLKSIRGVDWQLYGHDFNEATMGAENVHYFGKFVASRPPIDVLTSWGLVWDGDSVETCAGATGSYMRWNNPHKLSLYLAMGLPVIVWKEAAVSEFVLQNKVGLAVSALTDIPQAIADLSDDLYQEYVTNAATIAQRLRSGYYTSRALAGKDKIIV